MKLFSCLPRHIMYVPFYFTFSPILKRIGDSTTLIFSKTLVHLSSIFEEILLNRLLVFVNTFATCIKNKVGSGRAQIDCVNI